MSNNEWGRAGEWLAKCNEVAKAKEERDAAVAEVGRLRAIIVDNDSRIASLTSANLEVQGERDVAVTRGKVTGAEIRRLRVEVTEANAQLIRGQAQAHHDRVSRDKAKARSAQRGVDLTRCKQGRREAIEALYRMVMASDEVVVSRDSGDSSKVEEFVAATQAAAATLNSMGKRVWR